MPLATSWAEQCIKGWQDQLQGNDAHSIGQQMAELCWGHISFRFLWHVVRRERHVGVTSVLQNPLVTNAILGGYAQREALAVRRLVDRPGTGDRAVCSLPSVIALMKRERRYVTREAFVTRDGVPYDPAPHRRAYEAQFGRMLSAAPPRGAGKMRVVSRPMPTEFGLPNFPLSESRHEAFDLLSGTSSDERNTGDLISETFLDRLNAEFEGDRDQRNGPIRTLLRVANKFVAHAATPASREAVGENGAPIPFHIIMAAHMKIVGVGGLLTEAVCDDLYPVVPWPRGNELAHLLDARLPAHEAERLRGLWDGFPRWYSRRAGLAKKALLERLRLAPPQPRR